MFLLVFISFYVFLLVVICVYVFLFVVICFYMLRGRNGILKITLRWVSEASENPWKKGRKSVQIHVKHGWVGLGVMACSKMIQSAPCPGPFLRDKGVSWGAPQGPTAGANCSHHIHSNGCRAFLRGK